jgi:cytochrome c oxidase cbb3-type subunit III
MVLVSVCNARHGNGNFKYGVGVNTIRHFWLVVVASMMWLVAANVAVPRAAGQEQEAGPTPGHAVDVDQGKRLFQANCSTCHGVDASGAEGPNLRGVPQSLGDVAVQGIIRRGLPGTAMPGSSTLSANQVADIVGYLRTLDASKGAEQVTGDATKGKALYDSNGCSTCHMIAGQGGSIGPELTRIGAMRGPSDLKERLQDPGANLPIVSEGGPFGSRWTRDLMYRAVEKDGHVVEGMRVGEDSFTIVLKDAGGKFHGLRKPDLRSLEKEPGKSFMPSFKDTLSAGQMDDLVAYLMTLKGAQ